VSCKCKATNDANTSHLLPSRTEPNFWLNCSAELRHLPNFSPTLTTDLSEDVAGQWLGDTRCWFNELEQIDSRAVLLHRHHKELVSLELVQHLSPQFTRCLTATETRNRLFDTDTSFILVASFHTYCKTYKILKSTPMQQPISTFQSRKFEHSQTEMHNARPLLCLKLHVGTILQVLSTVMLVQTVFEPCSCWWTTNTRQKTDGQPENLINFLPTSDSRGIDNKLLHFTQPLAAKLRSRPPHSKQSTVIIHRSLEINCYINKSLEMHDIQNLDNIGMMQVEQQRNFSWQTSMISRFNPRFFRNFTLTNEFHDHLNRTKHANAYNNNNNGGRMFVKLYLTPCLSTTWTKNWCINVIGHSVGSTPKFMRQIYKETANRENSESLLVLYPTHGSDQKICHHAMFLSGGNFDILSYFTSCISL